MTPRGASGAVATWSSAGAVGYDTVGLGELAARAGRVGVVVGVPHGTFDEGTDEIGTRVMAWTGAGGVIATGFCGPRTGGVRLNVNRPTEGAVAERVTERARAVHTAYVERVRGVAGGVLRAYCEIHGNRQLATAQRIEVATVGVDGVLACQLRDASRVALGALRVGCGIELCLAIQPEDDLHFSASSARRWPPFADAGRVLHVELPRAARALRVRGATAWLVAALVSALEASQ
jgi:hypothetical protein